MFIEHLTQRNVSKFDNRINHSTRIYHLSIGIQRLCCARSYSKEKKKEKKEEDQKKNRKQKTLVRIKIEERTRINRVHCHEVDRKLITHGSTAV